MRKLLIIAGPLSSCSLNLYRAVAKELPCTVDVVHEPLPKFAGFDHERVSLDGFRTLDWHGATSWDLIGFARTAQPDAIIIHGTRPARAIALMLATIPRRIPVLFVSDINIRALVSERTRLLPRLAVYQALFARVDVALSLGITNELALRLLGARHIEPLPALAIDFDALEAAQRAAPSLSLDGHRRIVVVARLVEEKNLASAIEAMSSDSAIRDHCQLRFVGDGPLRPELEALARRRGVQAEFLGALPPAGVGAVVGHSDALFLPSKQEQWGIVVCEALGLGIPVIASPAVGAAISLAGCTGAILVADSPSIAGLATALRDFLARSDALAAAAKRSAARIRQIYALPNVASRLAALLRTLMATTGL
jgi:glycosyltransferase involved in cell wall biosynthesis